jgi:cysteine-rich repeat protein
VLPTESATCGNGVVDDENEACDGNDLGGLVCATLGYLEGDVRCAANCQFELSGCSGTEVCHDALDNDGDGLRDCADDDCASSCSTSCASAIELSDEQLQGDGAVWLSGTTRGHASELNSGCSLDPSGEEVVYRVTPDHDGVLDVELESLLLLTLSIRTQCEAGERDELGCSLPGRHVSGPASKGEPVYVMVDGRSEEDRGAYQLRISLRERVCGDGHRDAPEACDDANHLDDDGCQSDCTLQSSEREPNDSEAMATPFSAPFFASIGTAADVDVVRLELDSSTSSRQLTTTDLGDNACAENLMDTRLDVLDERGAKRASDDDSGPGLCASVALSELEPGTYFAVISAVDGAAANFPYELRLD